MAKWIWYDNDFEIYHNELVHCRRESEGVDYPCMSHIARPEVSINFRHKMNAETDTVVHVYAHGKGMILFNGDKYPVNCGIKVKKGVYDISVQVFNHNSFPSIFIDNEYLTTDETWVASCFDYIDKPVGFDERYDKPTDDPAIFKFEYCPLTPVSSEKINGGVLYDFGCETFGKITLNNADNDDIITLIYGESRGEALEYENATVREKVVNPKDNKVRPSRAFRYIFIKSDLGKNVDFKAEYEYLPIEDKAEFSCDDETISKIWDICAYTFHLNSREFYLDGIKRDRWVWAGDAYQSFKINRCLYDDRAIIKRTIRALLSKPPYTQHLNRINDYSALFIIGVYEYYFATEDTEFIKRIWNNLKLLYRFIIDRLDSQGYVVERHGDWVFVDWSEFDKSGAFCAEQILLWQVYNSMSALSKAVGDDDIYSPLADSLKKSIMHDFWNDDKHAFIDSFSSGKNHVTRHANIFAILFDFVDKQMSDEILNHVLLNDNITQITTPYFKLYELMAICKCGKIEIMQKYMNEYWDGMIKLGATSVWEEFDPTKNGEEHYAMYGVKYAKSLCHAWGSGPIYLLQTYVAGIRPTSLGSKTYIVSPNHGIYDKFTIKMPLNGGIIEVSYSDSTYTVLSDIPGGTLIVGGNQYEIKPNEPISIKIK